MLRPELRKAALGPSSELSTLTFIDQGKRSDAKALDVLETSRLILDAAGDGIYGLDLNGYVIFVNPAAYAMTGWALEDLHGRTQHSMVHHSHPDGSHYPREDCPIYAALRDGQVHRRQDEVFWRKDGSAFPVSYTSTPIFRNGVVSGAVIVFSDITLQLRDQGWERSKADIFKSILAHAPISVTLTCLVEAFNKLLPEHGIAIQAVRGRGLELIAQCGPPNARPGDLQRLKLVDTLGLCAQVAASGEEKTIFSDSCPRPDSGRLTQHRCMPLHNGTGDVLGTVSIFGPTVTREAEVNGIASVTDFARLVFEHDQLQWQLEFQARHDALTGLPNRTVMQDRLQQAIAAARRRKNKLAVCYIDLDRFKEINDSLGHAAGDEYLKHTADVLRLGCREIDTLARQGGDEFILLLPDLENESDVMTCCQRILTQVRVPFPLCGTAISPTASLGISIFPDDGDSPDVLLQNADTALYAAKRGGRDRIERYDEGLGAEVRRNAAIYSGLQSALASNQLSLAYQPLFNVERKLQGFEALLRWSHPTEGNVSPAQFIPVAEESGLIIPIGTWVLREACRQSVEWQVAGLAAVRMAVNVSAVQLARADFMKVVQAALSETGLAPQMLQLEITESWVVRDPVKSSVQLEALRSLGITISIDDFGTGHSSFGCLHQLPLDTLKIDRSFIARLDGSAKQLSTVRAIITLAHQLGLRTVAEGVETESQFEELSSLNCDLMQGYLMARPLTAVNAMKLLLKGEIQEGP